MATFKKISGNKISLRNFSRPDLTERYVGWLNDPEVVRFSNQRFINHDEKSCLSYLSSFKKTSNLFLAVERIDTGQIIGTLTTYINNNHGTAEVGILIGEKTLWGLGYGQDAWDTLLHWLERQEFVRKIVAGTLRSNQGMIKLFERSEMRQEAIWGAHEILDGKPEDILLYAKFV
jgi:RimJ/RimL family protein N-acetyltransferase